MSEIDDARFFLAKDGNVNPKSELEATIDALYNDTRLDDNSTSCKFPARRAWLEEELKINDFPKVNCEQFNLVMKKLDPTSTTLIFPSAHINSPASMFGHTLLRINSSYNSKLLSYAVNYAADADPKKENGVVFAIKGLFGGYFGEYSLLPYYEKLKEYRDAEQRDVWEYDLNLSKDETIRMFRHIWELNGTHSYYYFFTQNCSYSILWFIESARPSIHLREYFTYQVIPLETVHAAKSEGILTRSYFRPSKRTKLLKYEKLLTSETLHIPRQLVENKINLSSILHNDNISLIQKQYILEAAVEYLEYSYKKNDMTKDRYLEMFYKISKQRASLGKAPQIIYETPPNPIDSHRALRVSLGMGLRDKQNLAFFGIRPAYHDLKDSAYGFLRGTQIEFMNLEFSYNKTDKLDVELATILSIASLAQRSEFFDSFSWRAYLGFDRKSYEDNKANFITKLSYGYSWGNEIGYIYMMLDPFVYAQSGAKGGLSASLGFIIDKSKHMSTNIEASSRYYLDDNLQNILDISQNFRLSQNVEVKFKYNYTERELHSIKGREQTLSTMFNYYF